MPRALTAALRPIYQAPTEDAGAAALAALPADWADRYPTVVRSWQAHRHELATFYRYPEGLRRTIDTTNLIEGFHRQLRKVTKSMSLSDGCRVDQNAVPSGPRGYRPWTQRLPNWGEILGQLIIYFEDCLLPWRGLSGAAAADRMGAWPRP